MNILIIEDSNLTRNLVKTNILQHQINVDWLEAETLKESINIIDKNINKIDLIITDLMLPDSKDYVETIETIVKKAKKEEIPVVVLTGLDDERIIEKCIKIGAYTFLHKDTINGNLRTTIIAAKAHAEQTKEKNKRILEALKENFSLK